MAKKSKKGNRTQRITSADDPPRPAPPRFKPKKKK